LLHTALLSSNQAAVIPIKQHWLSSDNHQQAAAHSKGTTPPLARFIGRQTRTHTEGLPSTDIPSSIWIPPSGNYPKLRAAAYRVHSLKQCGQADKLTSTTQSPKPSDKDTIGRKLK